MPSYLAYKRQLSVLDADDKITWITVKGNHIPIKEGENKEEAIKSFFENKSSESGKTSSASGQKKSESVVNQEKPKSESASKNSGEVKVGAKPLKKYTIESIVERANKSKADSSITEDYVISEAVKFGKFDEKAIKDRQKNYEEYKNKHKIQTIESQTTGGHWEDGDFVGYKWKPERVKIQDEILAKTSLKDLDKKIPPKGEKPRLVVLGGRGGSGKSKFTYESEEENVLGKDAYDKNKFVVVDPDEYKTMLPEYKSLVDKGSKYGGLNAWEVHEESSAMKKRALDVALEVGANVVLDGTLAKYGSTKKVLDKFKDRGYIIDVAFMELPRELSAVRGINRGMRIDKKTKVPSGRFVPIDVMLGMTDCEENFVKLSKDADHWVMYHNEVPEGEKPKLVAKGGKNG